MDFFMQELKLTPEEKARLVPKLLSYLADELDVDAGQFDAEFLIDFLTREVGGALYNRGVLDAHAALSNHMDAFSEIIYQLEKPVDVRR